MDLAQRVRGAGVGRLMMRRPGSPDGRAWLARGALTGFLETLDTARHTPAAMIGKLHPVDIDAARPSEVAALSDVYVTTWMITYRELVPEAFYEEWLAKHRARDWGELLRRHTETGGGVLVARSSDAIVGLCQYGPTEDDDDDPAVAGQIHRLFVHPDRQRQGVGRALLAVATTRLHDAGMSTVTLWALENDQRARAFYERLGWRWDGRRTPDRRFSSVADVRYRLSI